VAPPVNHLALILVVEDDPNDVLLIRRTLLRASIPNPVHIVNTGQEALDYLAGTGPFNDRNTYPLPGLILLDLKLPGIDGYGVLAWIQQHPSYHQLRVVVLTSSHEMGDLNKAYRLGANTFLVKPLELEEANALVATLNAQLGITSQQLPFSLARIQNGGPGHPLLNSATTDAQPLTSKSSQDASDQPAPTLRIDGSA
jgi:CheY-like chemotaxis protein